MKNLVLATLGLCVAIGLSGPRAVADVVLYNQDFEGPVGFVNDGGDININRTVNQLYGGQPPGFTFAQAFTVETLLLTGNQAFGTGYSDPQHVGGNYALGMLSTSQDDLLSLSFNMQGYNFLNFRLDISSIDLDRFGGPFNPPGSIPVFEITLFDNPSGTTGLSGNGRVLDVVQITGAASSAPNVFNWTRHNFSLNGVDSTNGNVTIRIDELNTLGSGYAALDNFHIVASNVAVPEPGTLALFAAGAGVLAACRRRGWPFSRFTAG
jgi:hypothetical protein